MGLVILERGCFVCRQGVYFLEDFLVFVCYIFVLVEVGKGEERVFLIGGWGEWEEQFRLRLGGGIYFERGFGDKIEVVVGDGGGVF